VRATPLARRLAAERGIDLTSLAGSGAAGAITRADLTGATAAAPRTASARAAGMRGAIAAAMARAKREIPHYYLETAIDFGAARAWLDAANRDRPIEQRLLPAALLVRAVALALRDAPELNGFWIDDGFAHADAIHLGFAVSLRAGGGLLAPVLHDADRQSVGELMAGLRDRVARARAGRLRSSELSGATCTVTSLGEQGVDKVFGIIHPPQVSLVGFGAIREQAWARAGAIAVRPVLTATLSADHRASDGQSGARFLARVRSLLERPEEL
jgi:pyruvate dehydrogenase E2 component (dihydrolipoamide acetyltransferase)